jgi:hypothetical protein
VTHPPLIRDLSAIVTRAQRVCEADRICTQPSPSHHAAFMPSSYGMVAPRQTGSDLRADLRCTPQSTSR